MNKKAEINKIISGVLISLLILSGVAIIYVAFTGVDVFDEPQTSGNITLEDDPGMFYVASQLTTNPTLTVHANQTRPLAITCSEYEYFNGQEFVYDYVWVYPMCAIVEANPNMYTNELKEYNLCFMLINGGEVGKC